MKSLKDFSDETVCLYDQLLASVPFEGGRGPNGEHEAIRELAGRLMAAVDIADDQVKRIAEERDADAQHDLRRAA